MAETDGLRLIAETPEDLQVMSAALQDAVAKVGAIKYLAKKRRFSIEVNRFRWEGIEGPKDKTHERVRAILGIENVLAVKSIGLTKGDRELIISVLSIDWTPGDEEPGGTLTIQLAGDGELAIEVEVMDAVLLDSDYVWTTKRRPDHERRRK